MGLSGQSKGAPSLSFGGCIHLEKTPSLGLMQDPDIAGLEGDYPHSPDTHLHVLAPYPQPAAPDPRPQPLPSAPGLIRIWLPPDQGDGAAEPPVGMLCSEVRGQRTRQEVKQNGGRDRVCRKAEALLKVQESNQVTRDMEAAGTPWLSRVKLQ